MAVILKEDYDLLLCSCGNRGSTPGERINMTRVRDRLDELEAAGNTDAAVRLLDYWLAEARSFKDHLGEILVESEFVGLLRKMGQGERAISHGTTALKLIDEYGLNGTVTDGTIRINLATAYTAFGQPKKAMEIFEEAGKIYEARLSPDDGKLAGLYNNMGLCATALGHYDEGRKLFKAAFDISASRPEGKGEAAITCLNIADLASAEADSLDDEASLESAAEETEALVDKAWELLNSPDLPQDEYTRYIYEKCAPVFEHYGALDRAEELRKRAE